MSTSCASSHAAEKYEFVFHVPRRNIEYFSQNVKEVDTLNQSLVQIQNMKMDENG